MSLSFEFAEAHSFVIGGGLLFVFVALIILLASIFWLWMLIDCLTSPLPPTEKILWFCVIFFLHLLGAIIYYAVARGGARR